MRSLAALFVLALALVALHSLTASAPLAPRATLALGVLIVVAEVAGRLALRWRVPRVSAFVAAGAMLRPEWVSLVRPDEIDALHLVGDAALALFALRAGLAWRPGDAADTQGFGRYLTGSLFVPFAFTVAVVYSLHPWFPLTVHQPRGDALAVALALGALTVVAAPALAWATLGDAARGPLADALVRLHVARDVAALLLFAAALGAARPLASAGALRPAAFGAPLLLLGASALAAALLVWLVARSRRLLGVAGGSRGGGEPGVFLLVLAGGAAVAAWQGWVEAALVALLAGLGLAHADPETAEQLRRRFDARGGILAAGAFALVGIRLEWTALVELWPWILLLMALRAVGLYWGGRWAARGAAVTDALARRGWLGLISQASVGLVVAAAGRRAFPEWGVSFEALAVALVTAHAVLGPICLRLALARRPDFMEGASRGA